MANDCITNTYEEARKQRLQDNKKRFEDLGILKISKSLSDLANSGKKSKKHVAKSKSTTAYTLEPRRSSRVRNPVSSYCEEVNVSLPHLRRGQVKLVMVVVVLEIISTILLQVHISLQPLRKRSKLNSSWTSYLARPLNEVRTASYEERVHAIKRAEDLQGNLQMGNPSFVKSMVRSHVYSCFWLGLPSKFCEDHLPKTLLDIVLEDESGTEYEATYIGKRSGLSGGWRAFALDHKLDDGDALVFELAEPTRFKVYIVKACHEDDEKGGLKVPKTSVGAMKDDKMNDFQSKQLPKSKSNSKKAAVALGSETNHESNPVSMKPDSRPTRTCKSKKLT
ncbi:putative B3 domain-containing protein At5g58280 isoform X1 [Malania oleifera]|uniref:putative B3 domain-containing protein At5g58280 isoform X1 n=1 Tax=Malania oleifera TaxID=397392 RepID=UPI0025AEC0A2|nr:putative B3 domain-containing protein At5g58280 isoform X1 [Malania oleifera]